MNNDSKFDAAVIGGGLAGLSFSILLARAGYSVILFEKEKYPFHKVCGEYISLESLEFLKTLSINPDILQLPGINKLIVSAPNGKMLKQDLTPGGIGISRYLLDNLLMQEAVAAGVSIQQQIKVKDIHFHEEIFSVETTHRNKILSKIVIGAFGKKSNIDIQWKRPFSFATKNKINNYIGIKYHIRTNFPNDTIALHNFENGYCGLSKIEGDLHNLCYMTTAENLQKCKGDIHLMEKNILYRNPHLKAIFENSQLENKKPVVISQISFDEKSQVENHVLLTGDAAGMITPLCGNGMSMALHSAKIAATLAQDFLGQKISRAAMEESYQTQWQQAFSHRLKAGRQLQKFFGNRFLSNFLITILKPFPPFIKYFIRKTHGKSF
ncbi:MAG: NAD(P)/FAD-dependent oxidoreductase [Bacteroidota bacterium]